MTYNVLIETLNPTYSLTHAPNKNYQRTVRRDMSMSVSIRSY